MTDVPAERELLRQWADEARAQGRLDEADRMEAMAVRLTRVVMRPRSPDKSARVTPEFAAVLKRVAILRPDLSYMQIATHFGVNAGRVSEAYRNGK